MIKNKRQDVRRKNRIKI